MVIRVAGSTAVCGCIESPSNTRRWTPAEGWTWRQRLSRWPALGRRELLRRPTKRSVPRPSCSSARLSSWEPTASTAVPDAVDTSPSPPCSGAMTSALQARQEPGHSRLAALSPPGDRAGACWRCTLCGRPVGGPLICGEDGDRPVTSSSQAVSATRAHPFAADAAALADVHAGKPATATLLLPSLRMSSLDSAELVRGKPRPVPQRPPVLLPWVVPALLIEPAELAERFPQVRCGALRGHIRGRWPPSPTISSSAAGLCRPSCPKEAGPGTLATGGDRPRRRGAAPTRRGAAASGPGGDGRFGGHGGQDPAALVARAVDVLVDRAVRGALAAWPRPSICSRLTAAAVRAACPRQRRGWPHSPAAMALPRGRRRGRGRHGRTGRGAGRVGRAGPGDRASRSSHRPTGPEACAYVSCPPSDTDVNPRSADRGGSLVPDAQAAGGSDGRPHEDEPVGPGVGPPSS
jgi:hypothetical protein